MSEAAENTEILAFIGRKQIELENSRIAFLALDREYTHLLSLLSGVLSGEIKMDQVSIDLAARSWKIAPQIEPAEERKSPDTPLQQWTEATSASSRVPEDQPLQ